MASEKKSPQSKKKVKKDSEGDADLTRIAEDTPSQVSSTSLSSMSVEEASSSTHKSQVLNPPGMDDKTPRTIKQMAPHVKLFPVEEGGRPQDEIYVPFALARETQDGRGDEEPRPSDDITPPEGVLREG